MTLISDQQILWDICQKVRERTPLVLHLTNYVTANLCANVSLAVGASPLMSHEYDDIVDLMDITQALVINIGTLDHTFISTAKRIVLLAQAQGIPVILDPVGAGASKLRLKTCHEIMELADPLVIKGNSAEIMALAGQFAMSRGVDSLEACESAITAARFLQAEYELPAIVITGEKDYVVGEKVTCLSNGTPLLTRMTGAGCALASIVGAFTAVEPQYEKALQAAVSFATVASELAAHRATGCGSFPAAWIDALSALDAQTFSQYLRLSHVD
jgi:hydroxyethylthiazole kinase